MRSTHLVKGNYDDKLQQLAGEVAKRAIDDVRLLQRRGILDGMRVIRKNMGSDLNLGDCDEYKKIHQIYKLINDFKTGIVGFWCRAAGIPIDNKTLIRRVFGA
jgi:hypothetical protein